MSERFITVKQVAEKLSCSVTTVYARFAKEDLPKPRNLGGQTIRWLESDIDAWMLSRPIHDAAVTAEGSAAG